MNDFRVKLLKTLEKKPVLYITRDGERASGMDKASGYSVISNKHGEIHDTYELLKSESVEKILKENPNTGIVVFQNNSRIERFCKEKNWKLLNPSAELSKRVEEKLSQIEWLAELSNILPAHKVAKLKNIMWQGEKFVLQFNHAHTGEGTYIIDSELALGKLVKDFPDREARVVEYIDGPVFTANVIVGDEVLVGNISYQITGLSPFTDLPFSTIGNDWSLPYKILKQDEGKQIENIAQKIGIKLKLDGWRGLFGIDIIQNKENRKIYLLEINARQPASTTFESKLQRDSGDFMTVFEAHISALLGNSLKNEKLQKIKTGAQIIQRVTKNYTSILQNTSIVKRLEGNSLNVIQYENTEHNKDLLRIQTSKSFMQDHNILSENGITVRDIIQS